MPDAPLTPGRALVVAPRGKVGHLHQGLGIAARLGFETTVREVLRPGPLERLVRRPEGLAEVPAETDVVIASGRAALLAARRIALSPRPRPLVVGLGAPRSMLGTLDLAWIPVHDRPPAGRDDVVVTLTTPGRIAPDDLPAAAAALAPRLGHLPRPHVAVLVGGASRAFRFGTTEAEELGSVLAGFARANDASLLVTTSRRTGRAQARVLAEKLAGARAWIWDGEGPSPLAGMLGLADRVVVTCDSVNMLSEAALTGRPVIGWPLPGGRAKFDRFHAGLVEAGAMRWFDGAFDDWSYRPLDPAAVIAAAVTRRIEAGA